ncbi:MAG: YXWGXW repeat-containing protein [candidate division Zixibacteria bacterium]|nr:YXWGXW repeat-containing protein [candidate division Zixibacteria bacterium]MBU1469381.1 YXWGXW repeat-containing protein [candidate division Zixibacteria bacterium]MBU2626052.1 YXWGXW repeat-containing protein [candidate division Zixibacteria bacterium]
MRKTLFVLGMIALIALYAYSCAGPMVITEAPPPTKSEIKPPRPGPKAVWIDGYWKWNNHMYVWNSGHWERNPRGNWVPGYHKRQGRGHVWVAGHWTKR